MTNVSYNVIGDIAGNYKTLLALLDKMPSDAVPVSLGDMNDRGPRSKEVIDFFMANGLATNSNHGHLLVEAWKQHKMPGSHPPYYEEGIFLHNGGGPTLRSFGEQTLDAVPKKYIDYLERLPMYIETKDFIFSHAPLHISKSLEEASQLGEGFAGPWRTYDSDRSLIWNRTVPDKANPALKGKVNIFGHNSSNKVKLFMHQYPKGIKVTPEEFNEWMAVKLRNIWGICLDTSGAQVLTGLNTNTMELYQQEYID